MFKEKTNALFNVDPIILLERFEENSISLIYLDPPWNTSNDLFLESKTDTVSKKDSYAQFLAKIIQQCRRVLSKNGSLFCHFPSFSSTDFRLIVNQAFQSQPIYEIVWQKKPSRAQKQGFPKNDNETLAVYSKSNSPIFNSVFRELNSEEKSVFSQSDKQGNFRLIDLTVPFDNPGAQNPWHGFIPPANRSWRFSLEKLDSLSKENLIFFPSSALFPRLKQYLNAQSGIEIGTTWTDIPSTIPPKDRVSKINQRPVPLLERIIELASNPGDRVFDPFCVSGTTIVAAQNLGRYWWGAEKSHEFIQITQDRLHSIFGFNPEKDYNLFSEQCVVEIPVKYASYKNVLASIHDIAKMQNDVKILSQYIFGLKRLINFSDDASEENVEEAIQQIEHWITTSLSHQSIKNYIPTVCGWLTGWDFLDKASQTFLPQAEMLYDGIKQSLAEDYSPFIIQYCRALENEILIKLFSAYTADIHARKPDIISFLSPEIDQEKTKVFAKSILSKSVSYTFGEMVYILNLVQNRSKSLTYGRLLKDFREFVQKYFGENILDKRFLDKIGEINRDFRRKAAHPYILNIGAAHQCRQKVRDCLNELIMKYKK